MKWRDATMFEAIKHASGREPLINAVRPVGTESKYDSIVFQDGTAIACVSVFKTEMGLVKHIELYYPKWKIYD